MRDAPSPAPAAPPPSARGLAACLMALEREAQALDRALAAHLIAAAAAALLDGEEVSPASR